MRLIRHLFIVCILLFSAAQANAQNGQYDARFLTKTYNCANRTATIQLQVRAKDLTHRFNMGDANYRFEYDPRLIARPRIVAQPNFSNQPPANDANYNTQNLNGSTAGTTRGLVSVNTFYSGAANGAKQVDTAWMTVSELAFDVVKIDSCFQLYWHNDVTFPISGMSEVVIMHQEPFNFDLLVATSTGFLGNVQSCFKANCEANKQPFIAIVPIVVLEDSTFNGCYPIVDPDLGDTHTVTICGNPKNGTIRPYVSNGQICFTYQPNPRFIGQDSVCLTICDNTGLCTSQIWSIRVVSCLDTVPPVFNCPKRPILVSIFGEIVSNSNNFLAKAAIGDGCSGVKLDYNLPTATDNCTSTPSVNWTSGLKTGANFPSGTSTILFTAKDSAGFSATCTVQVIVSPKPTRLIAGGADTLTVCQNEIVDASATIITGANYRWVYSNGLSSNLQRITTSATLLGKSDWLRLTQTTGNCTYKDSIYVNIIDQPIVVNDNYETNRLLNGNVITNDTLGKGLKYKVTLMSNVESGTLTLNPNGTFIYNPTIDSTVTVNFVYKVCYEACPSSCQFGICYIKLTSNKRQEQTATNVITPNGDGVNDVLTILNFDGTAPTNQSTIVIYNQWGDVVHRATPYINNWNGTFNDNPLPDGTYYFIFKRDAVTDPIKNFVTIIR